MRTALKCLQKAIVNMKSGREFADADKNVHTVFTNRNTRTLYSHQQTIQSIIKNQNCTFVPNYQPALDILQKQNNINNNILLVGEPHHQLIEQLNGKKVITLQQICQLFPQKVPLSYRRGMDAKALRTAIQKRAVIKLQKQPTFSHVLITSGNIKMWDEAIQVVLDCHPSHVIVEFQKEEQNSDDLYQLSMTDFVQALATCHKIVHFQEKMPKLTDFNTGNRYVESIIEQIKYKNRNSELQFQIDQQLINNADQILSKGHKIIPK